MLLLIGNTLRVSLYVLKNAQGLGNPLLFQLK